jgi:hypothetical protein
MARINNSRKALFQTPLTGGASSNTPTCALSSSSTIDEHSILLGNTLLSKLDIGEKALANVHAENEFLQSNKELQQERMKNLKLLLNEIEEDNWKYDNVSKLIGI